jgi:hypothetical protein
MAYIAVVFLKHSLLHQISFAIDPILSEEPSKELNPRGGKVMPDKLVRRARTVSPQRRPVYHSCKQLLVAILKEAYPVISALLRTMS